MPNGQYPTILAGQSPTASLLQSLAPGGAWKTGDTPRTSTIVLAADPDLTIGLAVNAIYAVQALLVYTGATAGTGDLQVTPTVPAGSSSTWTAVALDASLGTSNIGVAHTGFVFGSNGTGSTRTAILFGTVSTSVTAGAVAITWAQNTSNSTATTMKANSWMTARRLA